MKDETNTCDKCGHTRYNENLIWLTAEDFQPLVGEVLEEESKKYDAVCDGCYESLLIKQ